MLLARLTKDDFVNTTTELMCFEAKIWILLTGYTECKTMLILGETANSIQPPESRCSSQEHGKMCNEKTCFSCNSVRESEFQIVRGTILVSMCIINQIILKNHAYQMWTNFSNLLWTDTVSNSNERKLSPKWHIFPS